MSIYKITGGRQAQWNNQNDRLKPGQIVQGKIVKLYPDNKARIKLGSNTMIAQLEASLTAGEKYHFQVKSTDRIIHLSVLGEQLGKEMDRNAKVLLDQLGFRASKNNIALLKGFINNGTPFEKPDIAQALQLLNTSKNKKETAQLLQQMIANKFPVTPSVLKALHAAQTSNLSEQISDMLSTAVQEGKEPRLIHLLERLHTRPLNQNGTLVSAMRNQARNHDLQLFSLFQFTGAMDANIDFSAWKSAWNLVGSRSGNWPFSLNLSSLVQSLDHINQQSTKLFASAKEVMQQWGTKLSEAIARNSALTKIDFENIKQQVTQSLSSNRVQPSFIDKLQNNAADLDRLFNVLKVLSRSSTYTNIEQLLGQIKSENTFLQAAPKEQFLMQLKQWLNASGMDYENKLANNKLNQDASLKGLLLQIMSTGNGNVQDQAGRFLHSLNGLQLQSIQESNGFLHINLHLPGEKLGLLRDIKLEFESRKTRTGEINPEHCRILFYLDLQNLNETVVDMYIQQRAVNVAVYNDAKQPEEIFGGLKNMLKQGLKEQDYYLSMVQYHKLHKLEHRVENVSKDRLSSQGVDYRI